MSVIVNLDNKTACNKKEVCLVPVKWNIVVRAELWHILPYADINISHYSPASHLFIDFNLFIHKASLKHTRLYRYEIFILSRKIFACSYYFNNAVGMFNLFIRNLIYQR